MSKIISLLIVLILLSGAGLLLYPTVSDQYNQLLNARRILAYNQSAQRLAPADNSAMLEAARAYNRTLNQAPVADAFSSDGDAPEQADEAYSALLNPNGDGIMGYIEIPRIGVRLPIYHTTADDGLERGVGHMEGTALPVGGADTHCGLAGHRGLPSARLFTDLDQLEKGDLFYISVLGDNLVYQVDRVNVVEPHELQYMDVEPGRDLLTLVTCTPYGLNTHRLLVRGTRVSMGDVLDELARRDSARPLGEAASAAVCALPFALLGLLFVALVRPRHRYK